MKYNGYSILVFKNGKVGVHYYGKSPWFHTFATFAGAMNYISSQRKV